MRKLGADHVVNYKTDADWGETVRKLSAGGEGVDQILEIGGPATLKESVQAIKYEGVLSIIGHVGNSERQGVPQIMDALRKVCIFRGVYVGSRQQMEEMVQAIEINDIHPVVDGEIFDFEKAKEAFQYQVGFFLDASPSRTFNLTFGMLTNVLQWDQKHFGNVVIKI